MDAERLRQLLLKQKVATMPELKEVLGTEVDVTVFRKLRQLGYYSSFSHSGKYYTLGEIAQFDELGLWCCESVWFSRHGTLKKTCEVLVGGSEAGYAADELERLLHVGVRDPLRGLARKGRIVREKVAGRFVYFSAETAARKRQLRARPVWDARPAQLSLGARRPGDPDELKAAIILFFSLLDERQRRLYAGLESIQRGHGGDRQVAEIFGLDPGTVAKGRRQLLEEDVERERVRRRGGGRKPVEKKLPRSSPGSRS
jgi:hypothetical protein